MEATSAVEAAVGWGEVLPGASREAAAAVGWAEALRVASEVAREGALVAAW